MQARTDPSEHLEQVLALVRERVAPEARGAIEAYVRAYYRQVDPDDLAERDAADLYGAALSHWNFARRRAPGMPRVRAFNPNVAEHGWQSTHTIVEIVNDDMPFLVDSATMALNREAFTIHLTVHPILRVNRQAQPGGGEGILTGILPDDSPSGVRESFIHLEVDRVADPPRLDRIAADLDRVLSDVRAAVADWKKMTAKVSEILAELDRRAPPVGQVELAETRAFLEWLARGNFAFLGYRCHDLVVQDGDDALRVVPGTSLGLLRERPGESLSTSFAQLPPRARAYARVKDLLLLTKSNSRSTVHRPGYLDYVGIKRYDERGEVCGDHRFLGLYAHTAYHSRPADIPVLRRKVAGVQARAGFLPGGHSSKTLENVLETYPRDELFQIGEEELYRTALGILNLGERQRLRLFVRRDPFERFVSCLIFAPRENYNTDLRIKWQSILTQAFAGTGTDFDVYLSGSALARVHMTLRTSPGQIPAVDLRELEARLAAAARRWDDDLKIAAVERLGEARGIEAARRFAGAFPAAYREDFPARNAVPDLEMVEQALRSGEIAMNLYRPLEAAPGVLRLKLVRAGAPVVLSDSLPMLERMGLRVLEERPHRIAPAGAPPVWLHDYGLAVDSDREIEIDAVGALFEDAFARAVAGTVENDDFNRLVLAAQLAAADIVVLRAYAKYLRQIGFPLSQAFAARALAAHPQIARLLISFFHLRLNPDKADPAAAATAAQAIDEALEGVESLNEDRVLRQYVALVRATTRTNFWRRDEAGRPRGFVSFKLDPSEVPGLPEPRPMFEIFVYSPRFEGVHLRGGKVARGGVRWSDRPEDFRTEVLGLVKAQMVKNAVIVPVGSKGGFVLKQAPPAAEREVYMAEGVACYKDYLRGLLDLTDNLAGGKVVAPPGVRRLDGDDPYLVVAADKGTATFSDHANEVAREYGFWLGDAFASGGSAGYDHKAMGITARGAWESVKRHFRELGIDTQTTDFTVVGIGDMSGDVFGNGMLLSRHIRLVAAFDHRHVFVDPTPDAAASYAERRRLFDLPRSSWADYNPMLISPGGGVWPRAAKSIPLAPQARQALGVEAASLTPNEVISAILKAPVDLLYNGGIGTYVKARSETHAAVGDRANDAIRVDGAELRCKVVAEGGNLGCTQLGRIEFALAGGRINTDAIDNSAGVDTSDHEVNIKILLGLVIGEGELTEKQRNALLAQMTGEVAQLVLRDNYFQTQSLSVSGRRGPALADAQGRFVQFLEKSGRLDRALEFLPTEEEIAARRAAGRALVSPERAVLLAYSKMWLTEAFLASTLPEDPWVGTALGRYFPQALREVYAAAMAKHPLRREIVATHVVNSMVNRVGATFVHRLMEETGAGVPDIVRAYLLVREAFEFVPLWSAIEALDGKVSDAVQAEMLIEAGRLIVRGTNWFLRAGRLGADMPGAIARFRAGVAAVRERFAALADPRVKANVEALSVPWIQAGVPADLARRVAVLDALYGALDVSELCAASGQSLETVAAAYFGIGSRLDLAWLRDRIGALPGEGHWQTLARAALRDDLAGLQRALATNVLAGGGHGDGGALVAAWEARQRPALDRAMRLLGEVRAVPAPDFAMLAVALRELRHLA